MRTAIYLAGLLVSFSIDNLAVGHAITSSPLLLGLFLVTFVAMDVIDFAIHVVINMREIKSE